MTLKKKICKKCGNEFDVEVDVSDYCQNCLKQYSKKKSYTCFFPKCGHIKTKIDLDKLADLTVDDRLFTQLCYYCEKLHFDFPTTLPDVSKEATELHRNCPDHTEKE